MPTSKQQSIRGGGLQAADTHEQAAVHKQRASSNAALGEGDIEQTGA